jgi:hypothetical protein
MLTTVLLLNLLVDHDLFRTEGQCSKNRFPLFGIMV